MRSRVLGVGMCLLLLLAGCGGSDSDKSPTATPDMAAAGSTAASDPSATTGAGSTTVAAPATSEPGSTDPVATPTPRQHQPGEVNTNHPRLIVTSEDLPRLREWAREDNQMWSQALLPRAEEGKGFMDNGNIAEDLGGYDWTEYPTESYAQLFAFMSLVHPDEAERADYAERARTLLMGIMDEAVKGPAEGEPWRDPYFSIFNRSRWWGESFGLTVDWIYPSLSAEDKATIRTVFLRWAEENTNATVTGEYNHPIPIGVVNDPELLSNPYANRWAINNYFTAHMRNIGYMALSFDEADDPGGELTGYLSSATGAWLYMVDALLRTEARGGMSPEGFEYAPQAFSYVIQFLLVLHTAGQDDPAKWGPQVVVENQPFWDEMIPAMLNSNSPQTVDNADYGGQVYQPAWYGDGEVYMVGDSIDLFGALGTYDYLTGNTQRLNDARWMQLYAAPGGKDGLLYRTSFEDRPETISYFLLFDPDAPEPTDPRPNTPTTWFAQGVGRILSRTDWSEDATWFDWSLGWQNIDHQHGDGLSFEFYRKGEWLTKERTGYGYITATSAFHNTLSLQNEVVDGFPVDDWRFPVLDRGSQWLYVSDDPPGGQILAVSLADNYIYALGDATGLYNSAAQGAAEITHVSRSIIWLKPDVIVTYDRATSRKDGLFKRYGLQFAGVAEADGNRTTVTTESGQQLFITTLLPTEADIVAGPAEVVENEPARYDPITYQLTVEAAGDPADVRFLNVLQGADAGASAMDVQTIVSTAGTEYAGAVIGTIAVLFPVTLGEAVQSVTYRVPTGTTAQYITGLEANGSYSVTQSDVDGMVEYTITSGGDLAADAGGVLVIGS